MTYMSMPAEKEEQHQGSYSKAPLYRNSASLKQYLDFGIIVRDCSLRFELLNIYLQGSGRGGQGCPAPWDTPGPEAASMRKVMESNILGDNYLIPDVKWKGHLG